MASPGRCPELEDYQQLLRGQLSSREVEQLAQHIEQCSRCAEAVQALHDQEPLHEVAGAARAATAMTGTDSMDALIERVCRQLKPASGTDTPQTIEAPSDLSVEPSAIAGSPPGFEEAAPEAGEARPHQRVALPCSFSLGLTAAVLLVAVGLMGYWLAPVVSQMVAGYRNPIPRETGRDGPSAFVAAVSPSTGPDEPATHKAPTHRDGPPLPAQPPPAPPPPSPQELARMAQHILRANCNRCHGHDGAVEGGFNYVLDRRQLVARHKVVPGNPEASRLYKRLTSSDDPMPPAGEQPRPGKDDIARLKEWIEAGAADLQSDSPPRNFVSETEILQLIGSDLKRLDEHARRYTRYFTITHLYNAGLSADELQTYRYGLARLVNGLSWERHIALPEAIDPARTVFRIDLRDYKWGEKEWDLLLAAYPYGVVMDTEAAREVYRLTRCRVAHVRADWFVFAASRPPLYHDLLQLPRTERELEKLLRVDVAADIRQGRVARAGFDKSGVALNNRLIERHSAAFGAYWKTYDFSGNVGRRSLFEHPLGPGPGKSTFQHAGGEIIFDLPNSLQGYLLVDAQGNRLDRGPVGLVIDKQAVKRGGAADVINGISCMACHVRGVIDKTDQVRETVQQNVNPFSPSEGDTIVALYPPRKEFEQLLKKDEENFRRAVNRLLGKAEERLNDELPQTDPVVALAARYEEDLDLELAAAEAGVRPADFREALDRSLPLLRALTRLRDRSGTVKRQVLEEAFPDVVRELRLGTLYRQQIVNSVGMRLTAIPAGTFTMGSPGDEAGRSPDEVQHDVEITQGFYMGVYEVTQEEYEKVMDENPSWFSAMGGGKTDVSGRDTRRFPVEQVSWEDANKFCKKLSGLPEERRAGRQYFLPTEAEWEYACRGRMNASAPFHSGQSLSSKQANFDGSKPYGDDAPPGRYLKTTTEVGSYEPNDFGLYDMHGNVAEWCADWYDDNYYKQSPPRDPTGPKSGTLHVLRGGSWEDGGVRCRAADRRSSLADFRDKHYGFRVVCAVAEKTP